MLISKALVIGSMLFAFFSIFAMFYSLFLTQLKFEDVSEYNFLSQDNSTWFKPKVKVVMFIIDALRFDYLLNYKNIDNDPKLQVNKLNKFNQAYFDHPERFQILRAISDTPTATVMRVPSLMTGNVPRKGSVLTAFGALPSIEDSIPRQLFNHGKKTFFSGDPILAQYFPKYLVANTEVEGFNIRDDQVDAPSYQFIEKHIKDDDYNLLISHLLGIDHMGHQYDLYDKHFLKGMDDLDTFLMKIMNMIDDNTMLIFAGDHGMVKAGAHGDGTPQEVNTAIVAYHKKGFLKNKNHKQHIEKVMKSINETDAQNHQADIVPTLAMLMGVPVPFSNMGKILNDLYPAGNYLKEEKCPDSAFEMQMLHDNHLNSLQVWNYFKKYHEGQTLFNEQEYSKIANLFKEVEDNYKVAKKMIKDSKQCLDSFHEVAIKAIQKSQGFSNTVYELVSETPPYDYVVFWQGFFMLALVSISYFMIVQYLYKTEDYEHITWKKPEKGWKAFTPIGIILGLIWLVALFCGSVIMRPLTSSMLAFAVWISGSAINYFLPKRDGYNESLPSTPGVIDESREIVPIISFKSLLKLQNPRIMLTGAGIVVYLFYLTHVYVIDSFKMANISDFNQFMVVMVIAARLCGKYPKMMKEIIIAALMIFPLLYMVDLTTTLWLKYGKIKIGFLFIADWLWGEIQFAYNKLKTSMLWSFQYVAHFIILIVFHLSMGPSEDFNQIFLPRVVWGIIIVSVAAGFALRLPRQTIKRHIQVNFVLYLVLMARPQRFLYFAIVLSIMRVIKHVFKKRNLKNPLYSMVLGFVGYIGMFASGYMDGRLPRAFGPAFIGLREFHLYFGITAFSIAMTSTIILGMLFISFLDQEVAAEKHIKLGVPSEDDSNCEKVAAQEDHLNVIKKRNALYYCFFFNLVMIGAAINTQVFKGSGRFALDKFLVDASLYMIVVNSLYFMM